MAYFGKLPSKLRSTLSSGKLVLLRKKLLQRAIEALFAEYRMTYYASNPALLGEQLTDAHGAKHTVYVRFQNFIFDYPVVAAWTLTRQNQVLHTACSNPRCRQLHTLDRTSSPHIREGGTACVRARTLGTTATPRASEC